MVAELGAEQVYARRCCDGRDAARDARPTSAGRLEDLRARARPRAGRPARASAGWSRATPSGRPRSTTSTAVEPLQALGGAPLGLWVRGPLRLDELTAPVAVVGARSATTYGDRRRGRARAPDWPAPAPPWSPARPSASTRPPTGVRWPATGRRSPCSPAAPTGPTRPRTEQLLDHLGGHGAIVSEVAPGCAPMRVAVPVPQPASSRPCPAAPSWSRRRSAAAPSTPRAGRRGSTGR